MAEPVCEHVPFDKDAAVAVTRPSPFRARGWVPVRCPCCGLGTWRHPADDLDGDLCPYCGVQSVPA